MLLGFKRHQRREFWINIFIEMADIIGISYDSLREKEVVEFFYLFKKYEEKVKRRLRDGRHKQGKH